jgi:hypothetical protein
MEVVSGFTSVTSGEHEVSNQTPLGTQSDIADNEQDHKSV